MKAVILPQFGGIEMLTLTDLPIPEAAENEVLIKIEALGINPVDAKARQGKAFAAKLPKVGFPVILGKDVAGTIVKKGAGVTTFEEGDRVFGIANPSGFGKTYAEYVATPVIALAKIPDGISAEKAAASPVAALTALQALEGTVALRKGQSVFIHAGAGGVGHFAIQFAKHIGAHVTATSSDANKDFILNTLGADVHIDYHKADFTQLQGKFDVVLDLVGLDNIERAIATTRRGGDVICVPSNSFELFNQKVAEAGVNGHTLLMQADTHWMEHLAILLASGILKPVITHTYMLEEMQEAHRQIESGTTRGKIVVAP